MTLPFRRRHHDDEGSHDRARSLASAEMMEPLGADEAGWLARHLDTCAECRAERDAFLADRALLRGMRERTPEPPRDLWARTSAALEREARTRRRGGAGATRRPRRVPFGAAAGALIVLVVIGASVVPQLVPPNTPDRSQAALVTTEPDAPMLAVQAGRVGWIRPAANGSWELVVTDVAEVCPRTRPRCQALEEIDPGRTINLGVVPASVTISPADDQLVVEARGHGLAPDRIFVVQVPPAAAVETAVPAGTGTPEPATAEPATTQPATTEPPATEPPATEPPATEPPATEPPATEPPATEPPATVPASPGPSPLNPDGAVEIASGVVVVGEVAYSADGRWLAFSARPSDGSTGPDLYLWSVGQPTAVVITTDHRTYFSAWLDGRVLASRVDPGSMLETGAPSAEPTAPGDGVDQPSLEAHPSSFLLDPETLTQTDIAQPDVWLPVVDPTGRYVAYWSGTLVATADGLDWQLGTGNLVVDGWSAGPDASPTADPAAASGEPAVTPGPMGPVGAPATLVNDETAAFKAKFDPSGTRLAVWVGEELDAEVGRLHLILLDPATGELVAGPEPLPGAPALRRFSIREGRLAWVSPSGQDGQESAVQVLGWTSTEFGEIRSMPAKDLYIVR